MGYRDYTQEQIQKNLKALEEGREEEIDLPARVLKREIPEAYKKAYDQEVKAYMKAYYQRPEVKAYMKAYNQRPEVKAYMKAYYQRPEVKAHKKAYMKAYYQKNKKSILKNLHLKKLQFK